ncbi:hypothetical protein L218DRAFT_477897 [Marasmius fiardii PR-910]|nr:hypothetical protein L218DRAFT_477897 [Marasmius fiardii PR-910]
MGYTYHEPPHDTRTEAYFRGQNEAFFTDRVNPQIRHASFPGNSQVPRLYPDNQPRYHHGFPSLPLPTGPGTSSNRWTSPNFPPDVAVKHDSQIPIWDPPLPIHPYSLPVNTKSEGPEDRRQAQNRYDSRHDPYGHRGPGYSVFDEHYDFSSSTLPHSPRYGVYNPHRYEISRPNSEASLATPNRMEGRRSGSPSSEGRPGSLDE